LNRHCEQSEAIHSQSSGDNGLRRFARNDGSTTRHTLSRHHPRKRVIQYSDTFVIESKSRGVLDTPHARGMTNSGAAHSAQIIEPIQQNCPTGKSLLIFRNRVQAPK
jgi:hypothetical protein